MKSPHTFKKKTTRKIKEKENNQLVSSTTFRPFVAGYWSIVDKIKFRDQSLFHFFTVDKVERLAH